LLPEYSANQKPFPDGSNASPVGILPPVGIAHSLRFALVVRPWTCLTDGATDTRTIKITKIAKLLGTREGHLRSDTLRFAETNIN
jgi:hypothetical protein